MDGSKEAPRERRKRKKDLPGHAQQSPFCFFSSHEGSGDGLDERKEGEGVDVYISPITPLLILEGGEKGGGGGGGVGEFLSLLQSQTRSGATIGEITGKKR